MSTYIQVHSTNHQGTSHFTRWAGIVSCYTEETKSDSKNWLYGSFILVIRKCANGHSNPNV